jgi:membrane-bound inhibitor of C-type lysozyme
MWVFISIVILGIVILLIFAASDQNPAAPPQTASTAQTVQVTYSCDGGKTIDATYNNATTATTTGNSVMLVLSDGRQMTLPQTISADGARYSNGNPQIAAGQPGAETFIFWSKGNGAFVQENGTTTYNNCLTQNSQ